MSSLHVHFIIAFNDYEEEKMENLYFPWYVLFTFCSISYPPQHKKYIKQFVSHPTAIVISLYPFITPTDDDMIFPIFQLIASHFLFLFLFIKSSSINIDWSINDDSLQQRFHPFSPKGLFSNAFMEEWERERKNYKNHSADDSQFNGFLLSLNYSCCS